MENSKIRQNSTRHKYETPKPICTKLVTVGNVPKATHCAKFGIIPQKGVGGVAIQKLA